ncbi:phage tail tube protein [Paenibacillus sp. 1P03SA]|uniref:phage tail tube protein n=1 Tax=Paenibacillus sp. 1P03SA TaxID=3132294 RepID=UPI0039A3876D
MGVLDASRIMNGSFGTVIDANGNWLTNVKSAEATVEINKEEVNRAGTRWVGHKVTSLKGSGTVTGYRVTTELIEAIGSIANDKKGAYVTEIRMKLDDPEAFGAMSVRLKGVQFDQIPLMKYELNSLVEEELPFTFAEYELMDKVKAQ